MTRKALFVPSALICFLLSLSLSANAQIAASQPAPAVSIEKLAGTWDARIIPMTKHGVGALEVPFGLSIEVPAGGNARAGILNGPERMEFSSVAWDGTILTLRLEQYDGQITARCDATARELTGEYARQTRAGIGKYGFRAKRANSETGSTQPWAAATVSGEWAVTFPYEEGNPDRVAPATFRQETPHTSSDGKTLQAVVTGTIAPVSGDYGLMSGTVSVPLANGKPVANVAPKVVMSRFDGIHTILLTGELASDGSFKGQLAFSASSWLPFTGVRKPESAKSGAASAGNPPDAETMTKVKNRAEPFVFSGVDTRTGKSVTQDDFRGKAVIVDIFGTWCPNCHDEAPLLVELYRRYHEQGLEIVALSYEYTADASRNARVIEVYRKKFDIPFTLLLAGTTDAGQIEKTLPQLVGFGAYPTTIFIGRDGRVQRIHAGFAGPSTGQFEELERRFDRNVQELLQTGEARK
ncbi:MAG TPA: TlpA disulfide reductase family protein [Clostridia bacterium]|nr:TlpA disulfide reductase family protein [Clostridia bacterium]